MDKQALLLALLGSYDAELKSLPSDETLEEVLSTLSARERIVLRLRFASHPRTLEQIGRILPRKDGLGTGVNKERVRQIEVKALRRLRHPSRRRKLTNYLEQAW